MVKVSGLRRLLLVALVLIVCRNNLVGAKTTDDLVIYDPNTPTDPEVAPGTFGWLSPKWKPYWPWLSPDTCGWDYGSTGIWWIVLSGTTECSATYGRNLRAATASMLSGRTFKSFQLTTGTVICTPDRAKRQVRYVLRVSARNPRVMADLRRGARVAPMKNVVSKANVMKVRSMPKGGKFFASDWVTKFWCNACPLTPDFTNPDFVIEDVTYNCTITPNGETCGYTCPEGFDPTPGTDPICTASGWSFSWSENVGGLPSCVESAPAGCADPPPDEFPLVYADTCTDAVEGTVCPFTCDEGIALTGSTGPTCTAGVWVNATTPAECVNCNVNVDCTIPEFPVCLTATNECVECIVPGNCPIPNATCTDNVCFGN